MIKQIIGLTLAALLCASGAWGWQLIGSGGGAAVEDNYCSTLSGQLFCSDFSSGSSISIINNTWGTATVDSTTFSGKRVLQLVAAAGPTGSVTLSPPPDLSVGTTYNWELIGYASCSNSSTTLTTTYAYRISYPSFTCNTMQTKTGSFTPDETNDIVRIAIAGGAAGDTFYIDSVRIWQP